VRTADELAAVRDGNPFPAAPGKFTVTRVDGISGRNEQRNHHVVPSEPNSTMRNLSVGSRVSKPPQFV
jgi:hypothetical protein